VLDEQEAVANRTAESVRKSLNEGVADLGGFAAAFASGKTPEGWLEPALRAFRGVHERYDSLAVVRAQGAPLARVGRLDPVAAGAVSSARVPGIDLRRSGEAHRISEYVPIPHARAVLVGVLDRRFLRFPVDTALPAVGWIVDRNGRVLAGGSGERSGTTLNTAALRAAARRAIAGDSGSLVAGGSLRQQEVVAFAPVVGFGPGGQLGLGVVTEQTVTSFDLPQVNVRRQAILAGLVIAFVVLLVFGWLWLVVLRPLFGLQSEAERIAYGDLAQPVPVERYDEIGLAARALERIRLLLIRARVGGEPGSDDEPARR
jgi:HAMP domain-containing protein